MVPAEIGDRLAVRREPPQQPHQLDVPVRLLLQPPARPDPVQVAIEIEPQQVAGVIARPAGRRRDRALEAQRAELELRDERIEEADRVVRTDVVVEDLGQKHGLTAIGTGDIGHPRRSERGEHWPKPGTHSIWNAQEFSHRLRMDPTSATILAEVVGFALAGGFERSCVRASRGRSRSQVMRRGVIRTNTG
jgi:hypothetical protein